MLRAGDEPQAENWVLGMLMGGGGVVGLGLWGGRGDCARAPGTGAPGTELVLRLSVKGIPFRPQSRCQRSVRNLWLERWVTFCSLSGS